MTTASLSSLPVIIEVALNGITKPDRNAAVPELPDELAADAIRCIDAGASVIHVHPHRQGLPPDEVAAVYAETFRGILAERPDAVCYPTMGGGATVHDRYDHHVLLAQQGLIRAAVVDPGSVNLAGTGADGLPAPGGYVYVNSPDDIRYELEVCERHRLGPSVAVYEPGFLRVVLAYRAAGRLPAGTLVKFYFSGGGYFGGGYPLFSAPPIPEALDLYLAMIAGTGLVWAVTLLGGSLLDMPVAQLAVERGGHLRVGLEDQPDGPPNAEQVARAASLAAEVGRPVASPAEAATLLGLPA